MKKFLATIIAAWYLSAAVAFANEVYSDSPQEYWNGDTNYPYLHSTLRTFLYLDKRSIAVEVNDPPYYIISVTVLDVPSLRAVRYDPNHKPKFLPRFTFFYDEEEVDMRIKDESNPRWRFVTPYEIDSDNRRLGELVFYLTQGRKFYGNYLWSFQETWEQHQGSKSAYWSPFDDSFYEKWR